MKECFFQKFSFIICFIPIETLCLRFKKQKIREILSKLSLCFETIFKEKTRAIFPWNNPKQIPKVFDGKICLSTAIFSHWCSLSIKLLDFVWKQYYTNRKEKFNIFYNHFFYFFQFKVFLITRLDEVVEVVEEKSQSILKGWAFCEGLSCLFFWKKIMQFCTEIEISLC